MDAKSEIKLVIENYIKAYLVADTALLRPIFHSSVNLLAVTQNKFTMVSLNDWLIKLDERKAKNDVRAADLEIDFIDVTHDTAISKIHVISKTSIITDYLTFLKIDNNWQIVSKIYDLKMV